MQATLHPHSARHTAAQATPFSRGAPATPDSRPEADISVSSDLLLRGHKSVTIVHNGAIYRLQATKLGKLILTK